MKSLIFSLIFVIVFWVYRIWKAIKELDWNSIFDAGDLNGID